MGPRGLLPLWSHVRALWLLLWWPLEAYMVVNFRARGISRGARKLTQTPTLIKKKATQKTDKNLVWLKINFLDEIDGSTWSAPRQPGRLVKKKSLKSNFFLKKDEVKIKKGNGQIKNPYFTIHINNEAGLYDLKFFYFVLDLSFAMCCGLDQFF